MHAQTHVHTHTRGFMELDKVSELLHYDQQVNNNHNYPPAAHQHKTTGSNDYGNKCVYVCVYGSKERPKKIYIFIGD